MSKYISFYHLKDIRCEENDPRSLFNDLKTRKPIDVFNIDKVEVGFLDTCIVHIGDKKIKIEMPADELEGAVRALEDGQILIVQPHSDMHLSTLSYEDDYRMPLVDLEERVNKQDLERAEGEIEQCKSQNKRLSEYRFASFGTLMLLLALLVLHTLDVFRVPVAVFVVALVLVGIAGFVFYGSSLQTDKANAQLRALQRERDMLIQQIGEGEVDSDETD